MLEGDLGGDFVARLGWDLDFAEVEEGPVEHAGQGLEKILLGGAALPADEFNQRVLRTAFRRDAPGLAPVGDLLGRGQRGLGKNVVERYE